MKMRRFLPVLIAGAVAAACGSDENQTEKGVTVQVKSGAENAPELVRLEVLGDKIIHVSATPESSLKDPESLIIVPGQAEVEYDVHENGDTTMVETSAIKAYVLSSTGEVWFTDKAGKMLLDGIL